MKVCSRCGKAQPEENFRMYYGGRKGSYKHCRTCERIEGRYKYLKRLGDNATPEQLSELSKIEKLYDLQVAHGFDAPGRSKKHQQEPTDSIVDALIEGFGVDEPEDL